MAEETRIGSPPWSRSEIVASLGEFSKVFAARPLKNNAGGMQAPHMFALWFMARRLSPDLIVESGVWKGQSTWLLEQACPRADLYAIGPNLNRREYVSERAIYRYSDFSRQDWTSVTDRSLAFFDDHQNAYRRRQQCQWVGFKHVVFDDNYPAAQGDMYSLKKAFSKSGFDPFSSRASRSWLAHWSLMGLAKRARTALLARASSEPPSIPPNDVDARLLQERLDVYYEFPPVFKARETRWGDAWTAEVYPTPEPLLDEATEPFHRLFEEAAASYNWICYAKLK